MDTVLHGLLWNECLVYIDDIIIYSSSFEEHLVCLENVFIRLLQAKLKLKPSKCQFGMDTVKHLDHLVSANGICVDPDKISAIINMPKP
jgi:hypothetical protein